MPFRPAARAIHILVGLLAAAAYLVLVGIALARSTDGSWSGFAAFALGWPLTLLGLAAQRLTGMAGVVAAGAIEWFLVAFCVSALLAKTAALARRGQRS